MRAEMRAAELEAQGYGFSCDMLGGVARTEPDARRYHLAYSASITALAWRPGPILPLIAEPDARRYHLAYSDSITALAWRPGPILPLIAEPDAPVVASPGGEMPG